MLAPTRAAVHAALVLALAQPTFRSNTRLVEVAVLVHDRNGQPVRDLSAADFQVYEEGAEQPIAFFLANAGTAEASAVPASPAPHPFSNRLLQDEGGVTVLLFDRLNTRFEDQRRARDSIVSFLGTVQPADKIALYVLESDVIRVLHDFTGDTGSLIRALAKYRGTTSAELTASETKAPEFARVGIASIDAETEAWLRQSTEAISSEFLRQRAALTADALEAIANHVAAIRGRKNLVWVSSAFPLVITDPLMGPKTMSREVSRATRAINNANVAVYPVDARGLVGAFANEPGGAPKFSTLSTVQPNLDSMRAIAEDTGGRVYADSNAIGESVRRAMDDARASYVLGYYPTHAEWTGKFRPIKVTVNRGGVDVRYRKGYLALPPQPRQAAGARSDALGGVLRAPFAATGIGLTARLDRDGSGSPNQSALIVAVDARSLAWSRNGEEWEAAIDVLVAQSESNGRVFKSMDTTVNLTANDERHAQMLAEGFTLTHAITLRDRATRLHVVVRDVATRTTGSLMVPADQVRAFK